MNLQATPRTASLDSPAAHFAGWHDSSFELRHGLDVTEHDEPDASFAAPPPWQVAALKPWLRPCDGAGR